MSERARAAKGPQPPVQAMFGEGRANTRAGDGPESHAVSAWAQRSSPSMAAQLAAVRREFAARARRAGEPDRHRLGIVRNGRA